MIFWKTVYNQLPPPRTNSCTVLQYIQGLTESIKIILISFDVKVAQKPFLTFTSHIFAKH